MAHRVRPARSGPLVSLVVIASTVWASSTSRSQPSEERATANAAARHFERAEKAFKLNDFAGAAKAFEDAYRASPHPDALWNAARSWERAGDLARAANLYAEYLRVADTDARDRGNVERLLSALASRLGRLEIVAPPGGQVWVDRS